MAAFQACQVGLREIEIAAGRADRFLEDMEYGV